MRFTVWRAVRADGTIDGAFNPNPVQRRPTMASEWYYTINGQQAPAPVTPAHLKQLASSGQLLPTDLVWQEGMANWMPASSVKGLFGSRSGITDAPPEPERPGSSRSAARRVDGVASVDKPAPPLAPGLLGWHPVLVALLSLGTGGIFGLVYSYLVCAHFAAEANRRQTDSTGRPLGRARHPLCVLLLSYLTLGVYQLWWTCRVIEECNRFLGRADASTRVDLALVLIFPPYAAYLSVVRLPERMRTIEQQVNHHVSPQAEHLYLFLLPCLLPALPFLSMAQQDALNRLWGAAP